MSAVVTGRPVFDLDAVECIACWRRGGQLDLRARVVVHPDGTRCLLPGARPAAMLRGGR